VEDATQRTKHGFALAQRPPRALGFAAQLYCLLCSCSSCPLQWPTGRGELCGYWLELSTSAATRWVESVPVITHARTVPDADASPILAIVRPSAFVFSESIAAEVALLGEIAIRPVSAQQQAQQCSGLLLDCLPLDDTIRTARDQMRARSVSPIRPSVLRGAGLERRPGRICSAGLGPTACSGMREFPRASRARISGDLLFVTEE
jgi:hypothetical protein